jgi:hypothetical protein
VNCQPCEMLNRDTRIHRDIAAREVGNPIAHTNVTSHLADRGSGMWLSEETRSGPSLSQEASIPRYLGASWPAGYIGITT